MDDRLRREGGHLSIYLVTHSFLGNKVYSEEVSSLCGVLYPSTDGLASWLYVCMYVCMYVYSWYIEIRAFENLVGWVCFWEVGGVK